MIITIKKKKIIYIFFSIILILVAILYDGRAISLPAYSKNIERSSSNSVLNKVIVLDARASGIQTGRCRKPKWGK